MSESETVKLFFNHIVAYQIEPGVAEIYNVGEAQVPKESAELLMFIDGVDSKKRSLDDQPWVPVKDKCYTHSQLLACKEITLTSEKNNIPCFAKEVALSMTDDRPRIVQSYVDAIVKTPEEFWVEKENLCKTEKCPSGHEWSFQYKYYTDVMRELASKHYKKSLAELDLEEDLSGGDQYSDTAFHELLKYHEVWAPHTALLLLCGLQPRGAINYRSNQSYSSDVIRLKDNLWRGEESNQFNDFGNISVEDNFLSFKSVCFSCEDKHLISKNPEAVEVRKETIREAKLNVEKLIEYWEARANPDDRLTPQEYVDWASSKGHEIHWLDWAIEKGLLQQPKGIKENELLEVKEHHESDYLIYLRQAARIFWGNIAEDDKTNHPSNKNVSDWLVEQGLSRTLGNSGATIIRPDWAHIGRKPDQ